MKSKSHISRVLFFANWQPGKYLRGLVFAFVEQLRENPKNLSSEFNPFRVLAFILALCLLNAHERNRFLSQYGDYLRFLAIWSTISFSSV